MSREWKDIVSDRAKEESNASLSNVFLDSSNHLSAFLVDLSALSFEGGIFLSKPFSIQFL